MIFAKGITLYHGSYTVVEKPDLAQCRAGKDFGRGFYLTTDYDQARRFVRSSVSKAVADSRISRQQKHGYVTSYKVDHVDGLRCREYLEADEEWLRCVSAHRMGVQHEMNAWDAFDVIAGKIANDNTNVVLGAYLRGLFGEIGSSEAAAFAIGRLIPENLKDQVCLRTQKALESIVFCEGEKVAL